MNNSDLGYNLSYEEGRTRLGLGDFPVARVTSRLKNAYRVRNENGEYLARITGKQMFEALSGEDYPAVGDWVVISDLENGSAVIRGTLPRSTIIKRTCGDKNKAGGKGEIQIVAANVDVMFVVQSVDRDYSLNRFERYFTIAENGGVTPAIVLNKTDLLSQEGLDEKIEELEQRFPGIVVIPTSATQKSGLGDLKKFIAKGKTYCFLGSSGVGKSSLINELLGESSIKTGGISSHSGRGRHTTTSRQMYVLENGGIVIDNPGMREVGITGADLEISALFEEIAVMAAQCKFADCTHDHEPGCEVVRAVRSGKLDEEKYQNYLNLKKESGFYEMSETERREKDRRFGKFIKQAKKELKDFGRKG